MYKIKVSSQKILERMLGKSFAEIVHMDCDEEIRYIQGRKKKILVFSGALDTRKAGRGNPLLSRKRIKSIDKVNRELARIK